MARTALVFAAIALGAVYSQLVPVPAERASAPAVAFDATR